jgi:hypothetical protein
MKQERATVGIIGATIEVPRTAVEKLIPIHDAQILTCLRLTGKEIGLPINFNVPLLKGGIRRCLNSASLRASASAMAMLVNFLVIAGKA